MTSSGRSRSIEMVGGYLVWGGGGHGKVVAELVRACGHQLEGFVDDDETKLGSTVEPGGGRVIHTRASLLKALLEEASGVKGIRIALGIGDNAGRQGVLDRLAAVDLPPLAHPSAYVSGSARMGRGSVVLPAAVVNPDARIGAAVIVNSGAIVEHDCVVGDGVHLAPNATLGGGVRVGALALVGAGATVLQGRRVGRGAIVGAGATIIRDVPDGVTVVGNPGRIIKPAPEQAS